MHGRYDMAGFGTQPADQPSMDPNPRSYEGLMVMTNTGNQQQQQHPRPPPGSRMLLGVIGVPLYTVDERGSPGPSPLQTDELPATYQPPPAVARVLRPLEVDEGHWTLGPAV